MAVQFELLHPQITDEHLGFLPLFLSESDQRPAKEQIHEHYVSGWHPFNGFTLNGDNSISFPEDPTLVPLAQYKLRDELIVFYDCSWVAIIQPDRSFEICRID